MIYINYTYDIYLVVNKYKYQFSSTNIKLFNFLLINYINKLFYLNFFFKF